MSKKSSSEFIAGLRSLLRDYGVGTECAWRIVRSSLRLDWPIGLLCAVYLLFVFPAVTRHVDNPQLMAAFSNDEPFLVMALDATTRFPWGNPGNYFDVHKNAHQFIPEYWGGLRYDGITYYGGAMYTFAFPAYAVLRLAGFPPFPTAPILLRSVVAFAALRPTFTPIQSNLRSAFSPLLRELAMCAAVIGRPSLHLDFSAASFRLASLVDLGLYPRP